MSPKRCVAYGCDNFAGGGISMHTFPIKNIGLNRQWVNFVKMKRKDWHGPTYHSRLCSKHFTEDCFPIAYRLQQTFGLASKKGRQLNPNSVPTIHAALMKTLKQKPKRKSMALAKRQNSQVLRTVKTSRTVGTQKSFFKSVRSQGTQTCLMQVNEDLPMHLTIASTMASNNNNKNKNTRSRYTCVECGRNYRRSDMLNEHMRTHTGEKPFKCEVCSRSFGHRKSLRFHKLIHTGEKPHSCDKCPSKFTRRDSLHRHQLLVHKYRYSGNGAVVISIKMPKCEICDRTFSDSSGLTRHKTVHTGIKQYKCVDCNKSFSLMFHLKRHLNSKRHLEKCLEITE